MPSSGAGVAARVLLTAAAITIVFAGLRAAAPLVVPLLFSAFLAILSAPGVVWLQRRKVPETLAVGIVVVGVIGALVAVIAFLGGSMNRFVAAIPRYQERLDALVGGLVSTLEGYGVGVSLANLKTLIDPGAAMGLAGSAVSQLAGALSNTLLVVLAMVFMLFEVATVPAKLRRALGDEHADLGRFSKIVEEINGYFAIKTYVSLGTGFVVAVALAALGVDFPVLWGLLAFLLNYVPNIGSIIAGVPPVLLALIQYGPGRSLAVLIVFVAVNTVIGNVVEPKLMGRRLGLSTLVVFLSLVFWGWMWGAFGMLLSVPLTMIVKILLENTSDLEWLAILMDDGSTQAKAKEPTPA